MTQRGDYRSRANPPILHRKETFLPPGHSGHEQRKPGIHHPPFGRERSCSRTVRTAYLGNPAMQTAFLPVFRASCRIPITSSASGVWSCNTDHQIETRRVGGASGRECYSWRGAFPGTCLSGIQHQSVSDEVRLGAPYPVHATPDAQTSDSQLLMRQSKFHAPQPYQGVWFEPSNPFSRLGLN